MAENRGKCLSIMVYSGCSGNVTSGWEQPPDVVVVICTVGIVANDVVAGATSFRCSYCLLSLSL